MKKTNLKRLNNKGFTLIELLAVVVILAVVMGIAMTNVLSAMNKARAGSLSDSATSVSRAFNEKYTESLVDGVPTGVYSDVLGSGNGYDFSSTGAYKITKGLEAELNISPSTYLLDDAAKGSAITITSNAMTTDTSFVYYNSVKGSFTICMIANPTGNNYVAGNIKPTNTTITIDGVTVTLTEKTSGKGVMYACSNGLKSW